MVRNAQLLALCSALAGVSKAAVYSKEQYRSGEIHEMLMGAKMSHWAEEEAAGLMDSEQYPELDFTPCENGYAAGVPGDVNNTFRCSNVDLYHFLPHSALGAAGGRGSSAWGWTSDGGREFIALGNFDGTSFAEITNEGKLSYIGHLPAYSLGSQWREIRVVRNYAVIGSEAIGHGIQFFDMRKLLDLDPESPTNFTQEDLTAHWDELPVGRTHNVVVNEELNYAVAVGSVGGNETVRTRPTDLPCQGGMIWLDLSDMTNVTSPGCAAGDGYVHDAQCLVYRGPDERYQGRDICYGYNEDTITIYDATDKVGNTTNIISITTFPGAEYIHQGVVLSESDQSYLFMDDEFDERDATVGPMTQGLPTTHIFDIRDLENPHYAGKFAGRTRSIDHNQYVVDGFLYQSNYGNGFNVWDVRSVPEDPSGDSVCEAGFFDTYPEDDEEEGGGVVQFSGSWHSYPYFRSGFIVVHTIERGTFVVKMTSKECPAPPVCEIDSCLTSLRASSIEGRLEEGQEFCGNFTLRQYDQISEVPEYAQEGCEGGEDSEVIARVSSACACVATPVVPELPRTTSRAAPPTALPT